ncbi:hypothetical protein [Marinobacter sp.]|uniref:hypothetical protein n=1 Tax=Marinobacter sp. TaxID=50741 RepID=UPI0034A26F26
MSINGFQVNHRYLSLPGSFYTRAQPTPLKDARMVCFNHDRARDRPAFPPDWGKRLNISCSS